MFARDTISSSAVAATAWMVGAALLPHVNRCRRLSHEMHWMKSINVTRQAMETNPRVDDDRKMGRETN